MFIIKLLQSFENQRFFYIYKSFKSQKGKQTLYFYFNFLGKGEVGLLYIVVGSFSHDLITFVGKQE